MTLKFQKLSDDPDVKHALSVILVVIAIVVIVFFFFFIGPKPPKKTICDLIWKTIDGLDDPFVVTIDDDVFPTTSNDRVEAVTEALAEEISDLIPNGEDPTDYFTLGEQQYDQDSGQGTYVGCIENKKCRRCFTINVQINDAAQRLAQCVREIDTDDVSLPTQSVVTRDDDPLNPFFEEVRDECVDDDELLFGIIQRQDDDRMCLVFSAEDPTDDPEPFILCFDYDFNNDGKKKAKKLTKKRLLKTKSKKVKRVKKSRLSKKLKV
ncbi:hypothetical protein P9112_006416 [Eukaryota sp. TZLM1-RC]